MKLRRRVCFPLWLWTAVWALHLLGADDWWDAAAAAAFLIAGFVPGPYDYETTTPGGPLCEEFVDDGKTRRCAPLRQLPGPSQRSTLVRLSMCRQMCKTCGERCLCPCHRTLADDSGAGGSMDG